MSRDVVTLRNAQSLPLAQEVMTLERLRHLPVVDDHGHLVGLVTHRDLLRAQVSALTNLTEDEQSELSLSVPVRKIMTIGVWTVGPETPALEAARVLADHRFGCLPVVDDSHKLAGIVTEADFLALAIDSLIEHGQDLDVSALMSTRIATLFDEQTLSLASDVMRLRQIRHLPVVDDDQHLVGLVTHRDLLAAQSSALSKAPEFREDALVGDIAVRDVWTASPRDAAVDAARTMREHRFGCLPVLDEGILVGLVTEADLLRWLVDQLSEGRRLEPVPEAPVNYYLTEQVETMAPTATVGEARAAMARRDIGAVAVVDRRNAMVGVLSQIDVLRAPHRTAHVRDVMTPSVVRALPHEPVAAAARRMLDHGVHRVFVVDDDEPVGVLSASDLFLAVRDFRIDEDLASHATSPVFTVESGAPAIDAWALLERAGVTGVVVTHMGDPVGMYTRLQALRPRGKAARVPVSAVMSRSIVTLPQHTPLYLAAARAADLHAKHILATRDGKVVGIATGMTMARALAARAPSSIH